MSRKHSAKRYRSSWVPLLILIGVIALRVTFSDVVDEFSFKVFDQFQRLKPREYVGSPVIIADLDDETLARYGQWPWPRTQVASLIDKLAEKNAAAIALDIVFAEPDRTSPNNILKLWKDSTESQVLEASLANLPNHDTVFATAISKAPVITGFILSNQNNGQKPLGKAGFAYAGDSPLPFLAPFRGAVRNLPTFERAAKGNGSFNFIADRDAVIRRVPIVFRLGEDLYPSLVTEALRVAQGASTYVVKSSGSSGELNFGEGTGIVNVKVGSFVIPTDSRGRMWLYDSGSVEERSIPIWKILEDKIPSDALDSKVVFVGSSAGGLKDLRATPVNPIVAGTEVHAQLLEQMLLQKFLNRPDWALGAEMVYLLALGLFLILLLPLFGAALCATLGLVAIAAVFGLSWHAFVKYGLLFDPVLPSVTCLVIYMTVSFLNYLREEKNRRQIRGAFGRYLAPALVEQLANHPEKLQLGGEAKNMTILFADIRGFTTLSEKLDATELTSFINYFLTPMTDIVLKNKGTIDKYMGDCIMAFWNAPFDVADHEHHACTAALEMQEKLITWNQEMAKKFGGRFQNVKLGIGINTGQCCVGNLGSDQRFDYSVLGDTVNLASRLQELSKKYDANIIIGEETYKVIQKSFEADQLDRIQVRGKTDHSQIYALRKKLG